MKADLLASADDGGSLRLWHVTPGGRYDPITLQSRGGSLNAVTFDDRVQQLVTVGGGGAVLRWQLNVDDLTRMACLTAGRNLTPVERKQYYLTEQAGVTCPP